MSLDHRIEMIDNKIVLFIKPFIYNENMRYEIEKIGEDTWPVKFFTATNDMKDFIGNVKEINGNKCSIRGIYRGSDIIVKNVIIYDKNINKINERVMVTEHINVNGEFELIATKKRILYPYLNFINIGWSNSEKCIFIRIDVYTGESKQCEGKPIYPRMA
jgi:hypothetical protein